jgi:endonuclease/exonuclease/phosphatase family metal-dependent hydrolase
MRDQKPASSRRSIKPDKGAALSAVQAQPRPSERVRVITYNIRKGKGASGRAVVPMASIGKALAQHEADVVLCQEVFHGAHEDTWQTDRLAEALQLYSYYGGNRFRAIGHHGNTTFSRLAAEDFKNHDISTNRIERRGALYVRLHLTHTPLHVLNVHLGLNRWQRATQMKRIAKLMDEMCKAGEPVLLAGDFNDWQRSLDRWIVEELGLSSCFDLQAPEVRTWPAQRPVFSLDRIYVRNLRITNPTRLHGGAWHELSDHLPLMADLHTL